MSSDEEDCPRVVVIDNGTWMIKAGNACGKTAEAYVRTVVGRDTTGSGNSTNQGSTNVRFYGEQACTNRNCELTCPMDRGSVENWDDMESLWEYIFTRELRDGIEDCPVLMTEVPGNSSENRQKIVEVMLEKFSVHSLYITDPAGLALISSGRLTGVVLDVGGSVTHVTAIHRGSVVQPSGQFVQTGETEYRQRSDIGGNDVTKYLCDIVEKKQKRKYTLSEIESLKHCLYDYTVAEPKKSSYTFPDGSSVTVDADMINCADILFNPEKIGSAACSIDTLLGNVVKSCQDEIKTELFANIILSGGTTLTPGVVERIKSRMEQEAAESGSKVCVVAPPERRKSSWLGGSILGGLTMFSKLCKTKEEYYEKGWKEFLSFSGYEVLQDSC